jgi:Helix-turn-helix domain
MTAATTDDEGRFDAAWWTRAPQEAAPQDVVEPERLIWTVREAAQLLGISTSAAYEAVHRGELIAVGQHLVGHAATRRRTQTGC